MLPFLRVTSRIVLQQRFIWANKMTTKTAVVLVAEGSEEMEAVITIDILRRAGIDVTVASVADQNVVKCSRGVNIVSDSKLSSLSGDFDAVILPGGQYLYILKTVPSYHFHLL